MSNRASRLQRVLGWWIAIVVLTGGALATLSLLDDERGAETPEEAAEALLDALNGADLLGVIDLLPDGERQLLDDIVGELAGEGDRLGLLGDDFELSGLPGISLEITEAELDVHELGDGIAVVTLVDGVAAYELDGDALTGALGDVVEAVADANDVDLRADDAAGEIDADEFSGGPTPFMVAVIEEDGRWYPSLAFTIAESTRVSLAPPGDPPGLDDGVEPDGGRNPLDAVQDLIDAAAEADLEGVLEVVDPGELGALQVYAELLFGELPTGEDTGISVAITDADVESLGGGVNRVVPTGLEAEIDFGGGQVLEVTLDGECVSVFGDSGDDELEDLDLELCNDDDLGAAAGELGEGFDDLEVPDALTDLIEAFEPVELGIITVERGGEHFVSPVRTFFERRGDRVPRPRARRPGRRRHRVRGAHR